LSFDSSLTAVRGETLFQTRIASDLSLKTPLSIRLASVLLENDLISRDQRDKYEVCFEEALKNAIVHGNQQDAGRSVAVRLFREEVEWGVTVEDEGSGFSPDVLDEPSELWEESGRGIRLMEHIVDRLEYQNGGRSVTLTVRRVGEKKALIHGDDFVESGEDPEVVRVTQGTGGTVATLFTGNLIEERADAAVDAILHSVREGAVSPLVLDLSRVTFLSSHAIGRLVALSKACIQHSLELRLCGLNDELSEIFQTMNLNVLFDVYESLELAIGA